MSDRKQNEPLIDATPARFVAGTQARNPETLEEFWMQMVLEDRADCAVPPAHLLPFKDTQS